MPMFSNLPEETIHEILSLCITPLHFFEKYERNRYGITPLPDKFKRHSQLLLVSKQWLRIGTPILYRHLRLTSQERTKTVAQVLAANEGLGLAIRALRLEGGMGRELQKIVSYAPNIESLYVARYTLRHKDLLAGLRRVIPLMNIRRLYYERIVRRRGNKVTDEVDVLLREGMRDHWREITLVGFVYEATTILSADLIEAVVQLPRVEEVQFDSRDVNYMLYPNANKIMRLATIPTLRTVRIFGQGAEKSILKKLRNYSAPTEFLAKFVFARTPDDDWRDQNPLMFAIFGSDTDSNDEDSDEE